MAAGDLRGAAKEYKAVVEMDASQWDAQNNLGHVYAKMGRPDSALHHYRLALVADPAFAGAHFNKGVLFASQGLLDSAIISYKAAIANDASHFEVLNNLGGVYEGTGDLPAAVESYQKSADLKEDFAPAHVNLGRAALLVGDEALAVKSAHRAIELDPRLIDGYITLSTVYVLREEFDRSLQFLEQAKRIAPDNALIERHTAYVNHKKSERIRSRDSAEMRVAHIVVENEALAEVLLGKLKDGEDFELLAKLHSIDPTGPNGGALGVFAPGDMMPELEALVQSLASGEVGGPLKTVQGFHVVKRVY